MGTAEYVSPELLRDKTTGLRWVLFLWPLLFVEFLLLEPFSSPYGLLSPPPLSPPPPPPTTPRLVICTSYHCSVLRITMCLNSCLNTSPHLFWLESDCSSGLTASFVSNFSSDLWALGCIIYQMVAGRPPFKGGSEYQTLQRVTNVCCFVECVLSVYRRSNWCTHAAMFLFSCSYKIDLHAYIVFGTSRVYIYMDMLTCPV